MPRLLTCSSASLQWQQLAQLPASSAAWKQTALVTYSIWLLVGFNIARGFFMFTKLPMYRVGFFMMANIALNYYLITYHIVSTVGWLAP